MFLNLNFFFLKNKFYNIVSYDLKFMIILLSYMKNPIGFSSLSNRLVLLDFKNKITVFYRLILANNNLNFLKLSIFSNLKYNLNKFTIPKKYSLTTVLKSPHTDKRSREQFHIISYKANLKYPLFFSIYNNTFLHSFFLFERGFNCILKTKILI